MTVKKSLEKSITGSTTSGKCKTRDLAFRMVKKRIRISKRPVLDQMRLYDDNLSLK